MLGDIVTATDEGISEIFRKTMPIFEKIKEYAKIAIPPIPRYVFGGCCADPTHSTNVGTPEHEQQMITAHYRARNTIKKQMIATLAKNSRTFDLLGSITPPNQSRMEQHLDALKKHTSSDNVHLTSSGYEKIAQGLLKEIEKLCQSEGKTATKQNMPETRNWKGFISSSGHGAFVQHNLLKTTSHKFGKGRRTQIMPYFRN